MIPGKPKGEIDPSVLEELVQFLQQRGGGEEAGVEGTASPAVEVEIGAAPEQEMGGGEGAGGTCPHCGKPY
jgi:hypothetical protein